MVDEVLLAGGGRRNPALVRALASALPGVRVVTVGICPRAPAGRNIPGVRAGAAAAITACLLGAFALLVGPRPAAAKSAYYEIRNACPCTGPTPDTFWRSRTERMACVEGTLAALRADGWPEIVLKYDRPREKRSPCGDTRFRCDGTPNRPCPRRTVCEVTDPFCRARGTPGVCMPSKTIRRQRTCQNQPPACGCDGKTYATHCELWKASAVLAHPLACSQGCGGPGGLACGPGEYCQAPSCGDGGAWGVCVSRPAQCDPGPSVCGCDGNVYASPCQANAAGVAVRSHAPCGDSPPVARSLPPDRDPMAHPNPTHEPIVYRLPYSEG